MFADGIIVADLLASAPIYQGPPPRPRQRACHSFTHLLHELVHRQQLYLQMVMSGPRRGRCFVPHHTAGKWGWDAGLGMARDFLAELWTFWEAPQGCLAACQSVAKGWVALWSPAPPCPSNQAHGGGRRGTALSASRLHAARR